MSKSHNKKAKSLEKEHVKIMKSYRGTPYQPIVRQEWTEAGDYFVKYSLYKEAPAGTTSANTSYINLHA